MGQLSPALLLGRVKAAYVHYATFFRNRSVLFWPGFVPLTMACILTALAGARVLLFLQLACDHECFIVTSQAYFY